MDLENSFMSTIENKVESAIEKVLKCLTELQALRKENNILQKEVTTAELDKQNLVHEVDKFKQITKDLKGQINTAYSVINAFNKEQADRNSVFSHQAVKAEAMKTENTFLTEQTSIFQGKISKLTIEKLELMTKCQQLEMNATIFEEKYTNSWESLQSLDKEVIKLEENQKVLKNLIEKLKIDVHLVNESIKFYKSEKIFMKEENLKMSEKITELLLRLPIDTQNCPSLIEECEKLSSALTYEKSKNIELSTSFALCVSNQHRILETRGQLNDKSVQTDFI